MSSAELPGTTVRQFVQYAEPDALRPRALRCAEARISCEPPPGEQPRTGYDLVMVIGVPSNLVNWNDGLVSG